MKALGVFLVIKDIEAKVKKNSIGLELTEEHRDDIRYRRAEIVSVGDDVPKLSAGDIISYDKHAGNQLETDEDQVYKVISVRDIVVVWTEVAS